MLNRKCSVEIQSLEIDVFSSKQEKQKYDFVELITTHKFYFK